MKRFLGLDLGTRTCGIAITDRANIMAVPYKLIKFAHEDYETVYKEIIDIIEKENITDLIIGLPKNMDSSLGFASQRSLNFIDKFKNIDIKTHLVDERLTTIEANRILHENNLHEKDFKSKVDMASAVIILDTFLRGEKNGNN